MTAEPQAGRGEALASGGLGRPAIALILLVGLIPFVWPSIPPLIDLPAHMARFRVQLDLADSASLQRFFDYEWRMIGNLGADLLVVPLAPLLGLEMAVKVIVLAAVAGTMGGILWISRELHGRIQLPAYAGLALAYNYALFYGFLNYCVGMAVVMLALGLWLNLTRRSLIRTRIAAFVVISFLAWIGHIVAWIALGAICFGAALAQHRRRTGSLGRALAPAVADCLPLLTPALVMLLWAGTGGAGIPPYELDLGEKAQWIAYLQRDQWLIFDILCALFLYALLALPAWRRTGLRYDGRGGIGVLILLLIFFVAPVQTAAAGSHNSGERLLAYAVALALASMRMDGPAPRLARILKVAIPAFLVIRLVAVTASTAIYDRLWQEQLAALDHVESGAPVASFVGRDCPGGLAGIRRLRLDHLPSMVTVRRMGFSNDQFALPGIQLLKIHHPDAGSFEADPSQKVARTPCTTKRPGQIPNLDAVLATLPRGAFDYLWLMDVDGSASLTEPWLTKVWDGPNSALYRISR